MQRVNQKSHQKKDLFSTSEKVEKQFWCKIMQQFMLAEGLPKLN